MGCSGPSAAASPSIVSTLAPSSCNAKTVQDLIALSLTCTTHAPHCEVSQPTCVPVSRKCSRSNCTSNVRGSTLAVMGLPFTVMDTAADSPAIGSLLEIAAKNVAICPPSAVAGGVRARNPTDFGGFDAANAFYSEPRDRCRSSGSNAPSAIQAAHYGSTNRLA